MPIRFHWPTVFSVVALLAAVSLALCGTSAIADVPDPLPDPDGKSADMSKPVKVYILMGQSNMIGFGQIGPADKKGTLEYATKTEGKFPYLVDDEGAWTVRKDVWCVQSVAGQRKDWLQPGFGAKSNRPADSVV